MFSGYDQQVKALNMKILKLEKKRWFSKSVEWKTSHQKDKKKKKRKGMEKNINDSEKIMLTCPLKAAAQRLDIFRRGEPRTS